MPLHIQQQPQPIVSIRFVCGTYFLHCYPHTLIRKTKNCERALSSRFFFMNWCRHMQYIYIYIPTAAERKLKHVQYWCAKTVGNRPNDWRNENKNIAQVNKARDVCRYPDISIGISMTFYSTYMRAKFPAFEFLASRDTFRHYRLSDRSLKRINMRNVSTYRILCL